jgi:fatty-acid desaturase
LESLHSALFLIFINPNGGADGPQLFVWGFIVSTLLLFHATCSTNSLAHKFGTKRYMTGDESRNNLIIALITLGEGWHNNHHHYPSSVKQGFYWWEIDITYWVLKIFFLVRNYLGSKKGSRKCFEIIADSSKDLSWNENCYYW